LRAPLPFVFHVASFLLFVLRRYLLCFTLNLLFDLPT
jgi:hypothetical protein